MSRNKTIVIKDEEASHTQEPLRMPQRSLSKKKTVVFNESISIAAANETSEPDTNIVSKHTKQNIEANIDLFPQDSLERLINKYTSYHSVSPPKNISSNQQHQVRKKSYSPRATVQHQPQLTQVQMKDYNFEKYQFSLGPYGNFRQAEYLEQYAKETKSKKPLIRRQLMELVFVQVMNRVDQEYPAMPAIFMENKQKWSLLLLKQKPFQEIFAEFTNRVQSLIDREITRNRELLGMYLTHPRLYKEKIPKEFKNKGFESKVIEMGSLHDKPKKGDTSITTVSASAGVAKINQQPTPGGSIEGDTSNANCATPNKQGGKFSFKREFSKKQKEKQDLECINGEFRKIMDRVKSIDSIVDRMGEAQDEMSRDVMAFEHEANQMEVMISKEGCEPLQKITEMLERWNSEPIHTPDEIQKFANELWVSLAEYEKDIKQGLQGHQIIIAMKEHRYMQHIEWIKNKFGFQAELYEQAFTELKLRQRKEMDRIQMTLCELESRLMNYQMDESRVARLASEEIPKFSKVSEATEYIHQLKNMLSTQFYECKQNKIINQELTNKVAQLEQEKADLHSQLQKWQHLFQYYQGLCIKKARDLGIFEANIKFDVNNDISPLQQQEQIKKIKSIEKIKNKMDLQKQEELIKTMEDILKFTQVMQDTTQHYKLYNAQIKAIFQELVRVGVIPGMRVKTNKTLFDQQTTTLTIQDQDRYDLFEIFHDLQTQTNQSFSEASSHQREKLQPKKPDEKLHAISNQQHANKPSSPQKQPSGNPPQQNIATKEVSNKTAQPQIKGNQEKSGKPDQLQVPLQQIASKTKKVQKESKLVKKESITISKWRGNSVHSSHLDQGLSTM